MYCAEPGSARRLEIDRALGIFRGAGGQLWGSDMEAVKEDIGQEDSHAQASTVRRLVGHSHEASCLRLLLGRDKLRRGDERAGVQVSTCHPGHNHICCRHTWNESALTLDMASLQKTPSGADPMDAHLKAISFMTLSMAARYS